MNLKLQFKLAALRIMEFVQAHAPILVPLADKLLHPFGICVGH